MFDSSSFAMGVKGIIISLVSLYRWIIIIRVVISWINPDPYNPIVQFLRSITDPALDGLRRYVPRFLWSTGLDFTPLLLIVLLQVLIMLLENIYI
ncbi:MAG: YggT family protein [Candidatus Latescibacterota bacterium]|nr:YggT family protein [Candidatus Latescibacterota bacterium]